LPYDEKTNKPKVEEAEAFEPKAGWTEKVREVKSLMIIIINCFGLALV